MKRERRQFVKLIERRDEKDNFIMGADGELERKAVLDTGYYYLVGEWEFIIHKSSAYGWSITDYRTGLLLTNHSYPTRKEAECNLEEWAQRMEQFKYGQSWHDYYMKQVKKCNEAIEALEGGA